MSDTKDARVMAAHAKTQNLLERVAVKRRQRIDLLRQAVVHAVAEGNEREYRINAVTAIGELREMLACYADHTDPGAMGVLERLAPEIGNDARVLAVGDALERIGEKKVAIAKGAAGARVDPNLSRETVGHVLSLTPGGYTQCCDRCMSMLRAMGSGGRPMSGEPECPSCPLVESMCLGFFLAAEMEVQRELGRRTKSVIGGGRGGRTSTRPNTRSEILAAIVEAAKNRDVDEVIAWIADDGYVEVGETTWQLGLTGAEPQEVVWGDGRKRNEWAGRLLAKNLRTGKKEDWSWGNAVKDMKLTDGPGRR